MTSPLLTPAQLQSALVGPAQHSPVLVDVRWALGQGTDANREAYRAEHLPGAAFLDLEAVLSDPVRADGAGGRHPMPSLERVQEGLCAAGVRQGRPVVFYDAATNLGAARAWWVATYYGVEDASVLDGGLEVWRAAGLPTASGGASAQEGEDRKSVV